MSVTGPLLAKEHTGEKAVVSKVEEGKEQLRSIGKDDRLRSPTPLPPLEPVFGSQAVPSSRSVWSCMERCNRITQSHKRVGILPVGHQDHANCFGQIADSDQD
ncbi:MAG: hypothetical protein Q9181_004353 [Wetmoreana brouardii]